MPPKQRRRLHGHGADRRVDRRQRVPVLHAGEFMERSAEAGEGADVVFLDPPRAGSDARFLASLLRSAPRRVVYISCNPDTLARDTAVLVRGGYRVERVQPVDLFPFTEHVETVVSLSRVER